MTETMALTDQLEAVNAYATYLQGDYITRDRSQFPTRNAAVKALRHAALAALDVMQEWPEIARTDGQHLTLQAPDGTLVLYSYEDGIERVALA